MEKKMKHNTSRHKKGIILAGLTAALLTSGTNYAADTDLTSTEPELIKCMSADSNKGQTEGMMKLSNGCPNNCPHPNGSNNPNRSWIRVTAHECEKLGGRPIEE